MQYRLTRKSKCFFDIYRTQNEFNLIPSLPFYDPKYPNQQRQFKRGCTINIQWLFWKFDLILRH